MLCHAIDDCEEAHRIEIEPFYNFLHDFFDSINVYIGSDTCFGRGDQQEQMKMDFIKLTSTVFKHLNEMQKVRLTENRGFSETIFKLLG